MNQPSLTAWYRRSILLPTLLSSLLCWLAFPPVGWGWIVWIAPIGWLLPIGWQELPGHRPYRALWLAGFVFWLLTVHWIRLPHPANYLALVVLASYLGCYLPAFVALSRVGVHRLRLPLWLVAPVVWTGLDLVRAHMINGFSMGSLAHTQVDFLPVIQIADLVGEYGVTFLIVLVAASLTQSFFTHQVSLFRRCCPLLVAMPAFTIVTLYGFWMVTGDVHYNRSPPGPRIALIQGNTPADWKSDPERQLSIMQEYARLSEEAVEQAQQLDGRSVDLIIWPETVYRYPFFTVSEDFIAPPDQFPDSTLNAAQHDLAEFVQRTDAAILTGIDRVHLYPTDFGHTHFENFNSSIFINKQGELVGTYDKMHRVIMGEYVPFAEWIPWLAMLTPITGSVSAGQHPQAFEVDEFIYCPNICYETTVPHLIRRQVRELAAADASPDVLVNLTNDAWFWGSSELDMHLACGIFRAIEMRLPLVIAANGGLSAYVDPFGNVRQVTPRQETATLLVDLPKRPAAGLTFYARWGDWFAGVCVVCCMVLGVVGWWGLGNGYVADGADALHHSSQSDVAS
ncbi:MAG: apolipoprotein N-acyltransferase [Planctomycetes bacterium]|nr:apolipoprotein N-acyltransferase [Planctomycetota bacterium]